MLRKSRDVFVYNQTKETFLAFRVRVADSILARLIGLLGKRSLKLDGGVWIVPSNAIHTFGMLFTFDAVMIDKDFKVVGVRELLRPWRIIWPNLRAESVIELPAHSVFKSRTEIGDQLLIERYESKNAFSARSPSKSEDISPAETVVSGHCQEEFVFPPSCDPPSHIGALQNQVFMSGPSSVAYLIRVGIGRC
jgi:uncharacterized protein